MADRINSRADLDRFIAADLKPRRLTKLPFLYQFRRPILHYTVMLRRREYLQNTAKGTLGKLALAVVAYRHRRLGVKLGFSITTNVFGPGLYIVHWGSIVISSAAQIGAGARLHSCVNISGSPIIGENVYFAPGAVLVGDITVGDGAQIGANSVVTRDVPAGATVLGNPGRVMPAKG